MHNFLYLTNNVQVFLYRQCKNKVITKISSVLVNWHCFAAVQINTHSVVIKSLEFYLNKNWNVKSISNLGLVKPDYFSHENWMLILRHLVPHKMKSNHRSQYLKNKNKQSSNNIKENVERSSRLTIFCVTLRKNNDILWF